MTLPILGYCAIASVLVPAAVGIVRYGALDKPMKILTLLAVLASVEVLVEFTLGRMKIANNFLSDYYRVVEVSLLFAVFSSSTTSRRWRLVLGTLAGLFAATWTVNMLFFQRADRIDNVMGILARVVLISMAAVTLWAQMEEEEPPMMRRPVFWVIAGVTLYGSGTIVILGLSNYLLSLGRMLFDVGWHLNWSLTIIANFLYAKGMLCKVRD